MFASQAKATSTVRWDDDTAERTVQAPFKDAATYASRPGRKEPGAPIAGGSSADAVSFAVGSQPSWPPRDSLLRTMAVCEKLSNAVVRNADAAELTRAFAQASGQTVVLLDPHCRPLAEAEGSSPGGLEAWNPNDSRAKEQLRMLAEECRPIRVAAASGGDGAYGWLVTPIIAVDTLLGYLLVISESSDTADDIEVIVAGYVASMFAVTLAREQTGNELGQRRQGEILDSLVTGHFLDDLDARLKAHTLGLADSGWYRIAVARINPRGTRHQSEDVDGSSVLAGLAGARPFAAVVRGTELVMLVPDQPPPQNASRRKPVRISGAADPFEALRAQQTDEVEFTFGVSEHTQQPEHAPQAMAQAQHAADLGVRLGRAGQTITYEELGIYRLLLQIGDLDQLRRYARDVLGPLIDYDAAHKPDLMHTLSTYLSQHESPKQTARILRVHVNTVSYRIQRIESLTSLNLADPDDRLNAHVAVKIVESLRANGTDQATDRPPAEIRVDIPRVS